MNRGESDSMLLNRWVSHTLSLVLGGNSVFSYPLVNSIGDLHFTSLIVLIVLSEIHDCPNTPSTRQHNLTLCVNRNNSSTNRLRREGFMRSLNESSSTLVLEVVLGKRNTRGMRSHERPLPVSTIAPRRYHDTVLLNSNF